MIETIEFQDPSKANGVINLTWLKVTDPTQEEINQLLQDYPMPEDFITGGLDGYEVPRTESFTDQMGQLKQLYIFLHPLKQEESHKMDIYTVVPISFIMMDDKVITVSQKDLPILADFATTFIENPLHQNDALSFLLSLFWLIAQRYIVLLTEIDQRIHYLEHQAIHSSDKDIFYELIGLNKGLVFFETAIEGNRSILESIKNSLNQEENMIKHQSLLRDVQVEQHQAHVMIYESKSLIEKLSDMISNVINFNLNNIMKVLTSWTILLTIPTILGGLWGMNVALPLEKNPMAFLILNVLCIIVMIAIYFYLKKNKML
ncbi:magnesium transporter CorA family protein [Vaginisenegalia massiliensis]|uniref:magnesium transporter CorA family protein n=1 Tax=Vaginisenegalia massiliensis TaxID=2058294 RepID=UPI000F51CD9F|nr:magnesium transporter CorA family protein [Vaginisenegalia massiliensis]